MPIIIYYFVGLHLAHSMDAFQIQAALLVNGEMYSK